MIVPRWLVFTIAAWVIAFGGYRLWVALRRDGDADGRSHWHTVSVFGRTKRAHLIYGLLYVLMGGMLVASGFGVKMPFAAGCQSMFGAGAETSSEQGGGPMQLTTDQH